MKKSAEEELTEKMKQDAMRFAYLVQLCKIDHGSRLIDLGTVMMASAGCEDLRRLVDEEMGQ